jgi:hypothetical protein
MDPKLVAALQSLLQARKNAQEVGEQINPSDEDAYIRRETGGKYSRKDLEPLLEASGSNMVRAAMNGATANLADNAIGLFSPQQADESRLRSDFYRQEHPYRDMLGGLLGAIVTGHGLSGLLGGAGEAKTVVQAAKAGAKAGAGYGAANGYGEADGKTFGDKLSDAGRGAIVGGISGGVLSGTLGAAGAAFSPARHATGRIASAIEKDGGLPALQARLQEFVRAGRGDQITTADLGPHLRQALDFAANASDKVLVPTAELLEARSAGRASRLLSDARVGFSATGMGEPNAALRAEQLKANTSKVGHDVFDPITESDALPDVSGIPLDKPRVARLWGQARAAGNLSTRGPLDDLIERLTKQNPGVPRDVLETGARQIASAAAQDAGAAPPAAERPPTLSDLMQLRRGVSGQVDESFAKGNGEMGNALKGIREHVDEVLNSHSAYSNANAQYKGAKDLERALQSGHDWWLKADARELARTVDALKSKPGALDEFRHGIASGLVEKLQSVTDNQDEARKLMQASTDLDAKLKVIFGDKNTFDTFMSRVKAEREMGRLSSTIGNSATARRMAAAGHDPENLGLDLAVHGPGMVKGALAQLAKIAMTKRVAEGMGPSLLTQGAPNIAELLKTLGQQAPLAGPPSTMMAPMGLMSLFGDRH